MSRNLDQWGCDWRAAEKLWNNLNPQEQVKVQAEIHRVGMDADPFHVRLEKIINRVRGEK